MTDARHTVTQSSLETFARRYLNNLDATIQEEGDRWTVQLPNHVDVRFSDEQSFEIILSDEGHNQNEESGYVLSPESGFTQQLLDQAAETAPIGRVTLTEAITGDEYHLPQWIQKSPADVVDTTFNPYYDRTAVCVFVRIDVETVSEYQTEFFEAITVDIQSTDRLPNITQLIIEEFFTPTAGLSEVIGDGPVDGTSVSETKLQEVITAGQEIAIDEVKAEINEIRQSASRAAESEFAEYKQLQEQRISEFQKSSRALSDRLQRLSTEVDEAESQKQRVTVLEQRRELKAEKEEAENELEEILHKKSNGFAAEYQEIKRRHAIDVSTTPKASTIITYERGELKLTLQENNQTATVRAPYAIGAGVTDTVQCENCGKQLSKKNPIRLNNRGQCCQSCYR